MIWSLLVLMFGTLGLKLILLSQPASCSAPRSWDYHLCPTSELYTALGDTFYPLYSGHSYTVFNRYFEIICILFELATELYFLAKKLQEPLVADIVSHKLECIIYIEGN